MSEPITNEPTSRLWKEDKAAQELDLEVSTLRRWRWSGRGPRYLKLGGAVRYEPAEIEAFKDASRRTSTSDLGPNTEAA